MKQQTQRTSNVKKKNEFLVTSNIIYFCISFYAALMDRPLPQIPLNPCSSTILADRPLWASIMNSSSGPAIMFLSWVVFRGVVEKAFIIIIIIIITFLFLFISLALEPRGSCSQGICLLYSFFFLLVPFGLFCLFVFLFEKKKKKKNVAVDNSRF